MDFMRGFVGANPHRIVEILRECRSEDFRNPPYSDTISIVQLRNMFFNRREGVRNKIALIESLRYSGNALRLKRSFPFLLRIIVKYGNRKCGTGF